MEFEELLQRAKHGDKDAREEIFLEYKRLLYKKAYLDGKLDEDLFQELSVTLVRCIIHFPG